MTELEHGAYVFTTLRAHHGECVYLDDHTARLQRHADALGFTTPQTQDLIDAAKQLAKQHQHARIKLIANAKKWFGAAESFTFPNSAIYDDGVRVHLSSWTTHPKLGQLKTGNYLPYLLARREAEKAGAFEALLMNEEGYLVDGSRTSLLLYKPGEIISLRGGLDGITREQVLRNAKELDIEVSDTLLRPSELHGQLLLAGTGIGLVSVGRPIDDSVRALIARFRLQLS